MTGDPKAEVAAIDGRQRLLNIRTKVRLISERTWRREGWGVCTGDLEREFILREFNRIVGLPSPGALFTPTTLAEVFDAIAGRRAPVQSSPRTPTDMVQS